MNNPTKRNRNIGTAKQGFKNRNVFAIPDYYPREGKSFSEKLTRYSTVKRGINGHQFTFVVEETKKNSCHACTIDDLEIVLQAVPSYYFQGLKTIVLRQPKRKEEIFRSVWGGWFAGYEFESKVVSAIVLEAAGFGSKVKWSRKIGIDTQKELKRLQTDGFDVAETKRSYEIELSLENVRNVQLYRTLLHEIGHHYHNSLDEDIFDKLPSVEKEAFAHNFADKLKIELEEKKIIPFPRIFNEKSILNDQLDLKDFQCA